MNVINENSRVIEGALKALDLVSATYGKDGGNVCAVHPEDIKMFDDGKMALQHLSDDDNMVNMGIRLVRDAALATWRTCGDNTTTTAIITAKLMEKAAAEATKVGINQTVERLKRESAAVLDMLKNYEQPNMDPRDVIVRVSTIAMHGDTNLGEKIGGLVYDVGSNGIVIAEPSKDGTVSVKKSSGFEWASGVNSEAFLNASGKMIHDNADVIVIDAVLESIKEGFFKSLFDTWGVKPDKGPLVIITKGSVGSFQATMVKNAQNGLPLGVVICPDSYSLKSLAVLTGAKYFSDVNGSLRSIGVSASDFGKCRRVSATMKSCSIAPLEIVKDKAIKDLIASESKLINDWYSGMDNPSDEETLLRKQRLSLVNGSTGTIFIPYISESQFNEMKESIEDGYRAAAAGFDGVLPGGGRALLFACKDFADDSPLKVACSEPFNILGESDDEGVLDTKTGIIAAITNAISVVLPFVKTKKYLCIHE